MRWHVSGRRLFLVGVLGIVTACSGATASPSASPTEGVPTTLPTLAITAEPTPPEDTTVPQETPTRDEAYQQLIASIPSAVATKCKPAPATQEFEPGQIGEADCDFPTGSLADYVAYSLFEDASSMNAFFDTQRKGHENGGTATGPGCGKGPGEGTWDNGRKDCYLFLVNDAWVMWTHDLLYIVATADRDDGDFAKLEQFWKTAGPVTP